MARARRPSVLRNDEAHRVTTPASAVAEIDHGPRPPHPARLPVAALTETGARRQVREPRDDRAHPVEPRAPEPGTRRGDGEVDRGRREPGPASRSTTLRSSSRLSMPRVAGSPAGKARPKVAHARRREQRVADGVERRVPIGVAPQPGRVRQLDAAEAQPVVRPERVAVAARRVAGRRRPRAQRARRASSRSSGERHLEIGRLAGDRHDRRPGAGQQLRLVAEGLRTIRVGVDRREQQRAARALGCLRATDPIARRTPRRSGRPRRA